MEVWECLITAKQAARLAKVNYKTLHYWFATGLLPAPAVPARGTGTRRRLGLLDIVRVRTVAALRSQGVSLQVIRQVVDELTERWNVSDPLASGRLVIVGDTPMWDLSDMALLDVMARGQLVSKELAIVPVAELVQDSMERMAALCAA